MDMDHITPLYAPRQMRNCLPCKKRKIKCDRKIPCGACALRGDGKGCVPVVAKVEEGVEDIEGFVSVREFKALATQVEELQNRLDALTAAATKRTSPPDASVQNSPPPPNGTAASRPPSPKPGAIAGNSRRHYADDEMVWALEDFQMSHRVNAMRNISDSPIASTAPLDNLSNAPCSITLDHPLSFLLGPETDYLSKAIAVLPNQQMSEFLVQQYFDKVEWFQRGLHYPTFIRQCRDFWADPTNTRSLSPDFVCIYLMVVCLGLRAVVSTMPSNNDSSASTLSFADRLYHVAEGVMLCSRFLHRQTFESLQALSLMAIYGYGLEGWSDATWAISGAAIKIAQNLGLNRLEAERPDKVWQPMWQSRLRREMGRRVWWDLVGLDWAHAIAHGSTYCIHPSQNLSALPANLDDDQLEDDNAVPHPMEVYTPISMHIYRFKFNHLYRQITDHMVTHGTPSYSFIMSMDEAIVAIANSLPKHFQNPLQLPEDANPSLVVDSIFLNLTANIRLVRLHRIYLLRGYSDPRYARSKRRCVESSHAVLRLIDMATRRAPVVLNFWISWFYAFSAAVPVCIDLLFHPTDEKRRTVHRILDTFREHSALSSAARNSVFVIERLLEVETSFSDEGERPSKRRRSSVSGTASARRDELLKRTVQEILKSGVCDAQRAAAKVNRPLQPFAESNTRTTSPFERQMAPLSSTTDSSSAPSATVGTSTAPYTATVGSDSSPQQATSNAFENLFHLDPDAAWMNISPGNGAIDVEAWPFVSLDMLDTLCLPNDGLWGLSG